MSNATTFRTDVACLAHRNHFEPAIITVIVKTELGYTSENRCCLELLTPAAREQYDRETAEMASYDAAMNGFYDGYYEGEDYFPTIELAIECARLEFAIHCVGEDLTAFNAPGECAKIAYGDLLDRLNAVQAQALHSQSATNSTY